MWTPSRPSFSLVSFSSVHFSDVCFSFSSRLIASFLNNLFQSVSHIIWHLLRISDSREEKKMSALFKWNWKFNQTKLSSSQEYAEEAWMPWVSLALLGDGGWVPWIHHKKVYADSAERPLVLTVTWSSHVRDVVRPGVRVRPGGWSPLHNNDNMTPCPGLQPRAYKVWHQCTSACDDNSFAFHSWSTVCSSTVTLGQRVVQEYSGARHRASKWTVPFPVIGDPIKIATPGTKN